ncbi:ABC transporter ATP-binding protein [Streptomyces chromofuscus]|uniref:ATP-binding cassette domain-containing protein n=1 Tax=Streptomyces chromofuscus TaxID=42881 RepID=A0A7M2T2C5_STRCW|nr:ATP-binding cassette domain-containing protein [Streptomyces chromofuscus]QOV42394.1 ATP-binding cassette domain-containing protein [Streptomyces chromofuscus]GGT27439.1 ABC transporter ATP-binding protein [Streptomyces chromofuscus]
MTVRFSDCTYRYKRRNRPVLDHFTYQIPEGVTILLGPNGAGKSTTLKLATSVLTPQSGRVTYEGVGSGERAYRRHVSWMPQHITAAPGLTCREQVAYTGWLKGMNRTDAWTRAREALALVNMAENADKKATRLSGGQLRRLGVAAALVHDCRVLLLDEPTAGMDPTQRRVFRDVIAAAAATKGIRVLMSTHDVADLAEDADHVTVLADGRIRYDGGTTGFLSQAPDGTPTGRLAEAAYTHFVHSV